MRLSLPAAGVVVGSGVVLLGITTAVSVFGGRAGPAMRWPAAVIATLTAVMVAALAARWLGSRLGTLAGLAQLTSLHVLLGTHRSVAETLFGAAVSAAMGAFALANVPGRLPPVERRWTRWVFYVAAGVSFALAGPVGPAFILAGCLLFVAVCADSRAARFFADPVGVAVFVLLIAARLIQPEGGQAVAVELSSMPGSAASLRTWLPDVLLPLAVAALPWTPLATLAVLVGLRQGHYATPIWRFFGCWLLGPLALTAVGASGSHSHFYALLPPLAVMGAAGLSGLLVWTRCRYRQFGGRRTGGR